ncbi:DegV family protein [Acholeplasma sp. OttesenSCG-928-E16]|nr:DegV family protein [Acholeplasma sp. OttesenSCG-928-E16]
MKKIKVTTDSVSDLSEDLLNEHNIAVLPLLINLGDKSEPDDKNMQEKIFEHVKKTGELPKTAARNIDDYISFFKANKKDDEELIHFCISQKMSAGFNFASKAAEEVPGVYVVDSKALSTGTGLLVLYACDLVKEGKLTASEIKEKCDQRKEFLQTSFVLDKLDFLYLGGRCNAVSKFFANLLNIKPMINVKEGAMGVGKKYRMKFEKAVFKYADDILNEFNTPHLDRAFITYTTIDEAILEEVKKKVKEKYNFKEVYTTVAGGTITSHCGHNTIGILYFNDGK